MLACKVSGPGGVVFGNAYSAQTTATFSTYGTYVLRLSADDTELTSSDEMQVVIFDSGPENIAPQVDQSITWPSDTVNFVRDGE
jgi:hypothetical protein